jgi:hypothetical protein
MLSHLYFEPSPLLLHSFISRGRSPLLYTIAMQGKGEALKAAISEANISIKGCYTEAHIEAAYSVVEAAYRGSKQCCRYQHIEATYQRQQTV